jgi:hypothetical protein
MSDIHRRALVQALVDVSDLFGIFVQLLRASLIHAGDRTELLYRLKLDTTD